MNKVLIILGLTMLYYLVLIYLDRKRRAAFKETQKKVMGTSGPLPNLEEESATALFGEINTAKKIGLGLSIEPKTTDKIALDNNLEQELEALATDLKAEPTLETTKEQHLENLAATVKTDLKEADIDGMVAKVLKPKRN